MSVHEGRWSIPAKWRWAKIGDVAQVVGGSTPSTNDPTNFSTNGIPWITPSDLSGYEKAYINKGARDLSHSGLNSCGAKLLPPGTVLFSSRAPIGYCVIADTHVSTNQGFKNLILSSELLPEFTRYYLLNSKNYIESHASGSTYLEISASKMRDLLIPIPPLDTQRQIAAKLDLLSSHTKRANDYLSTIPPLTERFRQSVLARAFTGELTADWRKNNPDVEPASELLERIKVERRQKWIDTYARNLADRARKSAEKKGKPFSDADWQAYYDKKLKAGEKKYEEPQPVDAEKEGLPEIPESWEWVRVSTLGDVQLGRQRSPKYHSGPNMVPYLRVANVFENRIDTTDVMEMHFDESDLEQYKLHAGDILLNEGQSAELVGRPAIYNNELPVACFTNTLVRYRVYEGVSKDFALMIFRGYLYTGKFKAIAKITTNIAHLGAGRFADMPFPLPPAEEQQEIARRVSDLLDLLITFEAQTDLATQQLDRLKSSTLSAMLSVDP